MPKSNIPFVSILNLIKAKIILITTVFIISILSSYYYNNNIKTITYRYNLNFNIINAWDLGKLKLSQREIKDLIKAAIFNQIKKYNPNDYTLDLEDIYNLYFSVGKPVDVDNFEETLNNEINREIVLRLEGNLKNLERKDKTITETINKQIAELNYQISKYQDILRIRSDELISTKKMMEKDFREVLGADYSNYAEMNITVEEIFKIKNLYLNLVNKLNLGEDPEFNQINETFNKIISLRGNIHNNKVTDELYTIKNALNDFNSKKNLSFYGVSDWRISNNKFSNLEIFIAGLSFGFLINALILFLRSDYLRKSLKY